MVILLPYFESDSLKNGSIITLIDNLVDSGYLRPSCPVNAHPNAGQCLEENQGVTKLGKPRPCLGSTKESLWNYIHDATEPLDFE
jgi:hypothetical protein